jgi:hypothetical protein
MTPNDELQAGAGEAKDDLCKNPCCGHPRHLHDAPEGECGCPSDTDEVFAGEELGMMPTYCPCSGFAETGPALAVDPLTEAWAEMERLRAERDGIRDVLREMAVWHGGVHEEGCSACDDCECPHKPFNDRVNSACGEFEGASLGFKARAEAAEAELSALRKELVNAREEDLAAITWRLEIDWLLDGQVHTIVCPYGLDEAGARESFSSTSLVDNVAIRLIQISSFSAVLEVRDTAPAAKDPA